MTAEQQLATLRQIAEQQPRTGLRTAMRRLSERSAVVDMTDRLRTEIAQRRAAALMVTNAGITEGLIYG